jgi:drug/metabolite transporter (DMT)-like permease
MNVLGRMRCEVSGNDWRHDDMILLKAGDGTSVEALKFVAGFILMVSCTVGGNLLMKQGASAPAAERVLFGIMGWRTFFGFCVFAVAGLIYSWVLRWMPLNVAQSFTSIQFVAVLLASSLILSEPISAVRWIGIALIGAGIAVVSLDLQK